MRKEDLVLPFDLLDRMESAYGVAYLYAIVKGNIGDNYLPWISEKYINCSYEKSEKAFCISLWDTPSSRKKLMQHQFIDLEKDVFQALQPDLAAFLQRLLSKRIYINTHIRGDCLMDRSNRTTAVGDSEAVIFGFESKRRVFLAARPNENGYLAPYDLPFPAVRRAICDNESPNVCFHLWNYRSKTIPVANFSTISAELTEYLSSRHAKYAYLQAPSFGVRAIRDLIDDCIGQGDHLGEPHIRNLKILTEHKRFMRIRMQYLARIRRVPPEYADAAERIEAGVRSAVGQIDGRCADPTHHLKAIEDQLAAEVSYLSRVAELLSQGAGEKGE